jgi:LEA14-like dessication related protein
MTVKSIIKWRLLVTLCLALSAVFLCSCSIVGGLFGKAVRKPEVDFADGRLTGISFDTADFMFDLRVKNPNRLGLKMVGLKYDFAINENSFLTGKQDRNLEVKAGGESIVQLPISLNFIKVYQTFRSLINEDDFKYNIKCIVSFDVPVLGAVDIPVNMKGKCPLPKLPRIALDALKLKKVTLMGAELQMDIRLQNPNAFSMLLKSFNYQFSVNGLNWVSARVEESTGIGKKDESLISIPIAINFSKVGSSVAQLFTGDKSLNYSLKTRLDLGISLPLMEHVSIPLENSGSIKLIK